MLSKNEIKKLINIVGIDKIKEILIKCQENNINKITIYKSNLCNFFLRNGKKCTHKKKFGNLCGTHFNKINVDLTNASINNDLDLIKNLLNNGADIHTDDDRILSIALYNKRLDIVEYLISRGANIHLQKELIIASTKGYLDIVKYLVSKYKKTLHKELDQALDQALISSLFGNLDIIIFLVNNGANIFIEYNDDMLINLFLKININISINYILNNEIHDITDIINIINNNDKFKENLKYINIMKEIYENLRSENYKKVKELYKKYNKEYDLENNIYLKYRLNTILSLPKQFPTDLSSKISTYLFSKNKRSIKI